MLKTLGRSVYLTQFEEQRASLSAFAAGGAPVFISLHISEEFDAAYCARVQEMCDFLSAQGWRILADVSEKTIRQFGCADLTALAKRLHLWGLRLDYGFSVEQMCALAQQLPVAVNASTTTPEVARQLAAGGGTVIAMHNFYPRPETGLDPEFLRESTAALQAEGLQGQRYFQGARHEHMGDVLWRYAQVLQGIAAGLGQRVGNAFVEACLHDADVQLAAIEAVGGAFVCVQHGFTPWGCSR